MTEKPQIVKKVLSAEEKSEKLQKEIEKEWFVTDEEEKGKQEDKKRR